MGTNYYKPVNLRINCLIRSSIYNYAVLKNHNILWELVTILLIFSNKSEVTMALPLITGLSNTNEIPIRLTIDCRIANPFILLKFYYPSKI